MAAKRRAKRKPVAVEAVAPTPEAMKRAEFERAGLAYRRRPSIDLLKERGTITVRQWLALGRYSDLFDQTERSPTRDSCDVGVGGGSTDGPTASKLRALDARYYLERELGSLYPIAEAVAGRGMSLSEWAIEQSGAKERRVYEGGKIVQVYYVAKSHALKLATIDIKFAGDRIAAALKA